MYPYDRVLVGVINRKVDFEFAIAQHWYRIPLAHAPRYIDAEYIAFYFSRSFKDKNGGIHYYAKVKGHELRRRRELLPNEAEHKRANEIYYRFALDDIKEKVPPILNPTNRPITFILTTWDRFYNAQAIADLYSQDNWFVERLCHNLRSIGIQAEQVWEDQDFKRRVAELLIRCKQGTVRASTQPTSGDVTTSAPHEIAIPLVSAPDEQAIDTGLGAIQQAVQALGGVQPNRKIDWLDIPLDG